MNNAFNFFEESDLGQLKGTTMKLPGALQTKELLINFIGAALQFPDYLRNNWDSFEECLTDLSWLSPGIVSLVHTDIPLVNLNDRKIYLEILKTACEEHSNARLAIWFPKKFKSEILSLLMQK